MPNPNAVVLKSLRFEPSGVPEELLRSGNSVSVILDDERRVQFDPADARSVKLARILSESLSDRMVPVYIEIDPTTSKITTLLIADITRVISLQSVDDGTLAVQLDHSHARHVLRRDNPYFAEFEQHIQESARTGTALIIAENSSGEVIQVERYNGEFPRSPMEKPPLRRSWRLWDLFRPVLIAPLRFLGWGPECISASKAQDVFNAMAASSCDPNTAAAPCIPFLYPDDGCWVRAHEMCRLMANMGLTPRKLWSRSVRGVWIYVKTKNHPACQATWTWHVAPTLCVGSWFSGTEMVFDPSLFTAPVTRQAWVAVQQCADPLRVTSTDAKPYFSEYEGNPLYIPDAQTALKPYRLKLLVRATYEDGPPFQKCS